MRAKGGRKETERRANDNERTVVTCGTCSSVVNQPAGEQVGTQTRERNVSLLEKVFDGNVRPCVVRVCVNVHPCVESCEFDDVLHACFACCDDEVCLNDELVWLVVAAKVGPK
jgi:hypothetical protein